MSEKDLLSSDYQMLAARSVREDTRDVPVLVISTVDESRKGLALGADDRLRRLGTSVLPKGDVSRDTVLSALREASRLVADGVPA